MANKTMHHLVIEDNNYEILDAKNRANIAAEYSASSTYKVGDVVLYNGQLYKCTTAITTAEAWTAAHWTAVTVGGELSSVKDGFDDLDDRVTALEQGGSGSGLTEDIKQALLQIAEKIAYIDDDGQDYYDALEDALYPPADLVSISAVYTQSGVVYDTDSLDSLKSDLVVTAHMSDSTTRTVTDYVLSGTLTEGTSTITVAYGGKTATFDVIVSGEPVSDETKWTNGVAYTYESVDNYYVESDGVLTPYNNYAATTYLYCSGASKLTFEALISSGNLNDSSLKYNAFYDENKAFISKFAVQGLGSNLGGTCDIEVPNNAVYFVSSGKNAAYKNSGGDTAGVSITPYA